MRRGQQDHRTAVRTEGSGRHVPPRSRPRDRSSRRPSRSLPPDGAPSSAREHVWRRARCVRQSLACAAPLYRPASHRVRSRRPASPALRKRRPSHSSAVHASSLRESHGPWSAALRRAGSDRGDRKSTRLNSSHGSISYAVFCLKKKKKKKESSILNKETRKSEQG